MIRSLNYFDIANSLDWQKSAIPISAAATAMLNRSHVCSGSGSDYTVTLPAAAANNGAMLSVQVAVDCTVFITLACTGAETIDGLTTRVLWAGENCLLVSNGLSWSKIAGKSIPMSFEMYQSAAVSNWTNGTITQMTFDTITINSNNLIVSSVLTAKRPAKWSFSLCPIYASVAGGNLTRAITFLYKNDVAFKKIGDQQMSAAQGAGAGQPCSGILSLASGDTVKIYGQLVTASGTTNVCGYIGGNAPQLSSAGGIESCAW